MQQEQNIALNNIIVLHGGNSLGRSPSFLKTKEEYLKLTTFLLLCSSLVIFENYDSDDGVPCGDAIGDKNDMGLEVPPPLSPLEYFQNISFPIDTSSHFFFK